MKTIVIFLVFPIFLLICLQNSITFTEPTKPTQLSLPIQMEIIKALESSGNPNAYNRGSHATGLYQITPICLDDFNQFGSINVFYDLEDMYDPKKNKQVATWYMNQRIPQLLNYYGYDDTVQNRLVSFNCGVGCIGRESLPLETTNYVKRYTERYNNANHRRETTSQ